MMNRLIAPTLGLLIICVGLFGCSIDRLNHAHSEENLETAKQARDAFASVTSDRTGLPSKMLANLNAQLALRRTVAVESNQFFDLANLGAVRGIEWESLRRELEAELGLDPLDDFAYIIATLQFISSEEANDLFSALPGGPARQSALKQELTTLALFLMLAEDGHPEDFDEVKQAVGARLDLLLTEKVGVLPGGDDDLLAYHVDHTYEDLRFRDLRRRDIEGWELSPIDSANYSSEFQRIAGLFNAPDPLVVDDPTSPGMKREVSKLFYDRLASVSSGSLEDPVKERLKLLASCLKAYEVLVKGERARLKMLSKQQKRLATQAKAILDQAASSDAPPAPAVDGGDDGSASVLEETLRVLGAFQSALSDEWRIGGSTREAFISRAETLQRRLIESATLSIDPVSIYSLAPLASEGLSDADLQVLRDYVSSLDSLHGALEADFLELEVAYSEVISTANLRISSPVSFVLDQDIDLEDKQKYLVRVAWKTDPPSSTVLEISGPPGAYRMGTQIMVASPWPDPNLIPDSSVIAKRGTKKGSAPEEVALFKKAFDEFGKLLDGGDEKLDKVLGQVLEAAEQLNLEVSAVTAAQIRETVSALSGPLSTLIKKKNLDSASLRPVLELLAGPGNTAKLTSAIESSGINLGHLASIAADINAENNAAAQRIVQLLVSLTDLHSKLREENVRHYTALSVIAKDEVERWMTLFDLAESFERTYRDGSKLFKPAPAGTTDWPTVDRDSDVLESLRRMAVYAGGLQSATLDPGGDDAVRWTQAAERLARGVEVLQCYQLMTSLNRTRASENSIALIGEIGEHQIRVDDIVVSGAELAISDNLDSIVAFHATGITDEDLRLLVGIAQQSLLIWIATEA